MNKQLINKYKPEFDHWLNEGNLLMSNKNTKVWITLTNNTWTCTAPSVDNLLIVINDRYVEFRKALAEGKVIEYLGQSSNLWQELENANFNLHQTCYRIQPDKPKFKVGDFVRYVHSTPPRALEINNINGNRYYFTNSEMSCLKHELEPWTPEPGDWCWFFNDDRIPTFSKFVEINEDIARKYFAVYPNRPHALGSWYKCCEPFIGELPTHLKD